MCPNLVSESAGKSSDPDIAVDFQQQASGGIAGGPSTEVRGIVAVGRARGAKVDLIHYSCDLQFIRSDVVLSY